MRRVSSGYKVGLSEQIAKTGALTKVSQHVVSHGLRQKARADLDCAEGQTTTGRHILFFLIGRRCGSPVVQVCVRTTTSSTCSSDWTGSELVARRTLSASDFTRNFAWARSLRTRPTSRKNMFQRTLRKVNSSSFFSFHVTRSVLLLWACNTGCALTC